MNLASILYLVCVFPTKIHKESQNHVGFLFQTTAFDQEQRTECIKGIYCFY